MGLYMSFNNIHSIYLQKPLRQLEPRHPPGEARPGSHPVQRPCRTRLVTGRRSAPLAAVHMAKNNANEGSRLARLATSAFAQPRPAHVGHGRQRPGADRASAGQGAASLTPAERSGDGAFSATITLPVARRCIVETRSTYEIRKTKF